MTEIISVVADLADDVFIREIDLSQPFDPMTNNELTLEQLKGIAGGVIDFEVDRKPMNQKNLDFGPGFAQANQTPVLALS